MFEAARGPLDRPGAVAPNERSNGARLPKRPIPSEKAHPISTNTVRAHSARRDRSGRCPRRFAVVAGPIGHPRPYPTLRTQGTKPVFRTTNPTLIDTNSGVYRVIQDRSVCVKTAYTNRPWISADTPGRAIYNTDL